ncbi:MAG TPA: hypothetical protein VFL41_09520 [Gaiellaceae bacterium]|nr:hypothetical protein [Gaiellaceae bacterium]
MTGLAVLEWDAVIVACAVSAGIHAALAPEHVAEGLGAGLGFSMAAGLLAVLAVALTRSTHAWALFSTVAVLTGLLASYALAITSGLPLLHPEPEPVTGLALFTKAVEAAGLLAATHLLKPAFLLTSPKGIAT